MVAANGPVLPKVLLTKDKIKREKSIYGNTLLWAAYYFSISCSVLPVNYCQDISSNL